MKKHAQHKLGLATSLCVALAGCSAHASFNAGGSSAYGNEPAASSAQPTHAPSAKQEPASAGSSAQPLQPAPTAESPATPTAESPATPAPEQVGADHDRGHGNDADGHDEQNPGKAQRAKQNAEDHDRGHGNDASGVDPDNPGKSKKKKK